MRVHQINTSQQFQQAITDNTVVVLDASASWCGPCKMISPLVDKWSDEFTTIHFAKFDVDEAPQLSMDLGIRAMPTFLFYRNGEKVDEFVGANPNALKRLVAKYASE